jgi:hypothetical protein
MTFYWYARRGVRKLGITTGSVLIHRVGYARDNGIKSVFPHDTPRLDLTPRDMALANGIWPVARTTALRLMAPKGVAS